MQYALDSLRHYNALLCQFGLFPAKSPSKDKTRLHVVFHRWQQILRFSCQKKRFDSAIRSVNVTIMSFQSERNTFAQYCKGLAIFRQCDTETTTLWYPIKIQYWAMKWALRKDQSDKYSRTRAKQRQMKRNEERGKDRNRKKGAGRLIKPKEVSRYRVWFKRRDTLTDVWRELRW